MVLSTLRRVQPNILPFVILWIGFASTVAHSTEDSLGHALVVQEESHSGSGKCIAKTVSDSFSKVVTLKHHGTDFGLFPNSGEQSYIADGKYLRVRRRHLDYNPPKRTHLSIYETTIDDFSVIDPEDGRVMINSQMLQELAQERLKERIASLPDKSDIITSSDRKILAFKVQTKRKPAELDSSLRPYDKKRKMDQALQNTPWDGDLLVFYDYGNNEVRELALPHEIHGSHIAFFKLQHDRFVIASLRRGEDPQTHWIFDAKTNRVLAINTPEFSQVSLSEDGKRALISAMDEERNVMRTWWVELASKAKWNTQPSKPIPFQMLGQIREFDGTPYGASNSLDRFVLDTHGGKTKSVGPRGEVQFPRFALVDTSRGKVKPMLLRGWPMISKKIREAGKEGIFVPWHESVEGQMTPDGRYFTVNLKMKSYGQSSAKDRNVVGFWDLESHKDPFFISSQHLDTPNDLEPNFAEMTRGEQSNWRRKFETRLTSQGQLILARAVDHLQDPESRKLVGLKWMEVTPRSDGQFDSVLREGMISIKNPHLDLHLQTPLWTGITNLAIHPRGDQLAFDSTTEGLVIAKNSELLPVSLHPRSTFHQIAPDVEANTGWVGKDFRHIDEEYRRTSLKDSDKKQIDAIFASKTLTEREQLKESFDVFARSRLAELPENQRARVQELLNRLIVRKLDQGQSMIANNIEIALPPKTLDSAALYGILAHELTHLIRIVKSTPTLSDAEVSRLYSQLHSDAKTISQSEFEAIIGEWEYWHQVPESLRLKAASAVEAEMTDPQKKFMLLEMLKTAGQSAEAYLENQFAIGRRMSAPRRVF